MPVFPSNVACALEQLSASHSAVWPVLLPATPQAAKHNVSLMQGYSHTLWLP